MSGFSEVDASAVAAGVARSLGLPNDVAPIGPEALAAILRAIATVISPCSSNTLADTCVGLLRGLLPRDSAKQRIVDMIRLMVAYGDLVEAPDREPTLVRRTVIYPAAPAFVLRTNGDALLMGTAMLGSLPLPASLMEAVVFAGHTRRLPASADVDLLRSAGFIEWPRDLWLRTPSEEPAESYKGHFDELLESMPAQPLDEPELELLDFEMPVENFIRRRRSPRSQDTGHYVARRPQKYGAPLWCYVALEGGLLTRLVDLPAATETRSTRDTALRLQCAIDACREGPQFFRRIDMGEFVALAFYGPMPAWAERQWDQLSQLDASVVEPAEKQAPGSLFVRVFGRNDVQEEEAFCHRMLWLTRRD